MRVLTLGVHDLDRAAVLQDLTTAPASVRVVGQLGHPAIGDQFVTLEGDAAWLNALAVRTTAQVVSQATAAAVSFPMTDEDANVLLIGLEWLWRYQPPTRADADQRERHARRRHRVATVLARIGPLLERTRGWSPRTWAFDVPNGASSPARAKVEVIVRATDATTLPPVEAVAAGTWTPIAPPFSVVLSPAEAEVVAEAFLWAAKQLDQPAVTRRGRGQGDWERLECCARALLAVAPAAGWTPAEVATRWADPVSVVVRPPRTARGPVFR